MYFGTPFGGSFLTSLSFKMLKECHINMGTLLIFLSVLRFLIQILHILYVMASCLILPFLHFSVPLALLSSTRIFLHWHQMIFTCTIYSIGRGCWSRDILCVRAGRCLRVIETRGGQPCGIRALISPPMGWAIQLHSRVFLSLLKSG